MSESEIPSILGDYRLTEFTEQVGHCYAFEAVQLSIKREVVLVLLNPELADEAMISSFRADVRAKAGVHQVNIGQIFEVQEVEGYHFFTRQKITGESLDQYPESQRLLMPSVIFRILQGAAEAFIYLEERHINSLPLELKHIFINSEAVCHLKNTALAGTRDPQRSDQDLKFLGEQLAPLVDNEGAGAGRAHALLKWMRGEEREVPITWQEVLDLCRSIDDQFTSESAIRSATKKIEQSKKPISWIPEAIGVFAIVILVVVGLKISEKPLPSILPEEPKELFIKVTDPESKAVEFSIQSSPVSIKDYGEFLEQIKDLTDGEKEAIQHPQQPASKVSFKPTAWEEMQKTAMEKGQWKGRTVSLDSPVTSIDFWDAWAYAKWNSAKIATVDQWESTLNFCREQDLDKPLVTGIREWTATVRQKPSFPIGRKYPKIINQTDSTIKYDFTENRNFRSSDLSFRLLIPEKSLHSKSNS